MDPQKNLVHIGNGLTTDVWNDSWVLGIEGAVPKLKHGVYGFIKTVAELKNINGE